MFFFNSISYLALPKSYDPDRHCGVIIEQIDELTGVCKLSEPCTRSLTCKVNTF